MTKAAKYAIVMAATFAGMAWIAVCFWLGDHARPYLWAFTAAYPWMFLGVWWLVGTLSSVALTCAMEEKGVTWGALGWCSTFGGFVAPFLVALAALFGPLVGAISLGEKFFPDKKPPKEYPPNHWSKRVVFKCPGKA